MQIEVIEQRTFLASASVMSATSGLYAEPAYELQSFAQPNIVSTATPMGFSPSKIQTAYGFNSVSNNGAGQTIALIDAYDDPAIQNDLTAFDAILGLPDPPSFSVISQTGSGNLPPPDPAKSWEMEESLDVEWAHALAPAANIVLVEANSAGYSDLVTAVQTAANLPVVSVISMSWGGPQFVVEAMYDAYFTTPSNHQGVTFVASTGDAGAPGEFPSSSSNVLAVGGTTLTVGSSGNYSSETGWSGSGGGVSPDELQPSYQKGVVTQSGTMRTIPDVSFDANPNSGVPIYDSFNYGTTDPWTKVGGTSFAAPAWGAIIAIADEGRVQNGLGTLDGPTQTLPMLYQLDQSNPSAFHDIISGNNGNAAAAGYDLVTGIGSPVVNQVYAGLGASPFGSQLAIQQSPASGTAGTALGTLTVAVENQAGMLVTTDNSTVKLSIGSGPGGFAAGSTISVQAVNGIATFSNLVLNSAGSYTITASDGSLATASSSAFTVNAAQASQVVVQQAPTTGSAGTALQPVTALVEDQFGNIVTSDSSVVTISASGPGSFSSGSTINVAAVNGVATFGNLILNVAASYALQACDGNLASGPTAAVVISAGQPAQVVFQQVPATGIAGMALQGIGVLVKDQFGNIVTTDDSTVTVSVATGSGGFTSTSTLSSIASGGIATFTSLVLDVVDSYTLQASDGGLTVGLSPSIAIGAAAATQVVFQVVPTSGTAGSALPALSAAVEDPYGNVVVTDDSSMTISVSSGSGSFSSTSVTTANAVNGIATFGSLVLDNADSYTFQIVDGSLVNNPSSVIAIGAAQSAQVAFQPVPTTGTAGVVLPLVVAVEDQYGNVVTGDSSMVTLTLTGGVFSTGGTTASVAAVNGIATFTGLTINTVGNYRLTASDAGLLSSSPASIGISPGAAYQLLFLQQPPASWTAGVALNPLLKVAVEDAYGNVVASDASTISLTLSSGTFSNGSNTATAVVNKGLAWFNVTINKAGSYTLAVSDGSLVGTSSNTVISS